MTSLHVHNNIHHLSYLQLITVRNLLLHNVRTEQSNFTAYLVNKAIRNRYGSPRKVM